MLTSSNVRRDAYVYSIVVDGVVRYIGKGSGVRQKRAKEHLRAAKELSKRRAGGEKIWARHFIYKLARAWENGSKIEHVIVADGLEDAEAYAREIDEIARWPREQLWNREAGGLGGQRISEETRRLQSEAAKRRADRERERLLEIARLSHTPERREKSRQIMLKRFEDPEYRARNRERAKAMWADPYRAARMNIGLIKGRSQSSSSRTTGRWSRPGASENHSAAMKAYWAKRKAHISPLNM